jgi:hypothetical protein
MNKKFKLTTPVLFLIFNRLETTKKVFAEIKKAKPAKLYIAADGPRNEEEKKKTDAVREYVLKNIDWPCKVKTLFREKNLGCKYAVSSAITWFFENVEQGIILEDDCLPSQSFFRFCQELLERYNKEEKVFGISGYNMIEEKTINLSESYFFLNSTSIWGWATWKRAWEKYDVEIHKKISFLDIIKISKNFLHFLVLLKILCSLKKSNKTWDYQLEFSTSKEGSLWIIPKDNLVENIGFFSEEFTNLKPNNIDIQYLYKRKKEIKFPLSHQMKIESDKKLNNFRIKKELKRILLKKIRK